MQRFVTDLDKLLDDFEIQDSEIAKENVNCEIYDSSGYISLRTSSVLSEEDIVEERHTPVPSDDDSGDVVEISTPTRSDPLVIEDQTNDICVVEGISNNEYVNSLDSLLNDFNNTEVILDNNYEYISNVKYKTSELITDAKDSNEVIEDVEEQIYNNDQVSNNISISQDPPKRKFRPNSLLGLCSVVSSNVLNDEKLPIVEDNNPTEVLSQEQENTDNIKDLNDNYNFAVENNTKEFEIEDPNFQNKEFDISITMTKNESNVGSINESEIWQGIPIEEIGIKEPMWITDNTSDNCMECQLSFTMFRRRHHCRACGRLLCNKCCGWRIELRFISKLFPKERVCSICFQYLTKNEISKKNYQNSKNSNIPCFNNDKITDKSSDSPNLYHKSSDQSPNETVSSSTTSKSVIFADGIRPGGDLTEFHSHRIITPTNFQPHPHSNSADVVEQKPTSRDSSLIDNKEFLATTVLDPELTFINNTYRIFTITKNLHVHLQIIQMPYCTCTIKDTGSDQQWCDCDSVDCWYFFSVGLETIGIEEIVFVLKKLPDEDIPPIEIFKYYFQIYQKAYRNETKFDNMEMYVHLFEDNSKDLKEWAGILHIRPSFQSFEKLPFLPSTFLFGIMIHKMELVWATILPLRLILALGNQSRFYPCSIVSDRKRPSVYGNMGQSIIQVVLPKLISLQIMGQDLSSTIIPSVPGMWLHLLPTNETIVQIPKCSYSHLLNVLSSWQSKRIPLSLVSTFSLEADSYLVCSQNIESGMYSSGAINIQNTERNVTGATMILFVPCKNNEEYGIAIVEDVIVVKLSHKQLGYVINCLKTMTDIVLQCGPSKDSLFMKETVSFSTPMNKSIIKIVWTESRQMCDMASITRPSLVSDETIQNALHYLPYDENKILKSHRIPTSLQSILEYENDICTNLKLVWTRYHMVEIENTLNDDPVDFEEIIHEIAYNFALSIVQFLDILFEIKLVNIGFRTTIMPDAVDWISGCSKYHCNLLSNQGLDHNSQTICLSNADSKSNNSVHHNNYEPLPDVCLEYIKEVMVPFLYSKTSFVRNGSLITELEFHIIN